MAISKSEIKLLASQKLTDDADAGGRMTSNEVIDGQANNLFPDISRLDRTYGRVSLRKAFVAVQTTNDDTYYGTHVIVTNPPNDPNVSVTLFTRGDPSDHREEARAFVEAYITRSYKTFMKFYGNQLAGQRSIIVLQPTTIELPKIGDTYEFEDYAGENSEAVRITDIEHQVRTYISAQGSAYNLTQITLTLSTSLSNDYEGGDPHPTLTTSGTAGIIYATQVADSAKYYGVAKLDRDIIAGTTSISVDSIYTSLIPSTRDEIPISNHYPFGSAVVSSEGGSSSVLVLDNASVYLSNTTLIVYLSNPVTRGSVQVTTQSTVFSDNGDGTMFIESGTFALDITINYQEGTISLTRTEVGNFSAFATVTAIVGASQSTANMTFALDVTLANRNFTHVTTLPAPPSRGSIFIDYMALGNWYRLVDNGAGNILGDAGVEGTGVGTVDYVSGIVNLTLGALPDEGSKIIYGYGATDFIQEVTATLQASDTTGRQLYSGFIDANAVSTSTITWTGTDSLSKSATCTLAGVITGDMVGTMRKIKVIGGYKFLLDAVCTITPNDATYTIDYGTRNASLTTYTSESSGTATVPVGTVYDCDVTIKVESSVTSHYATFIFSNVSTGTYVGVPYAGHRVLTGEVSLTIDRDTGVWSIVNTCTFLGKNTYHHRWYRSSWVTYNGNTATVIGSTHVSIKTDDNPATSQTTLDSGAIRLNIKEISGVADGVIIPKSLYLNYPDATETETLALSDDGLGNVIISIDPASGVGTDVGNINYSTGEILLVADNTILPDITKDTVTPPIAGGCAILTDEVRIGDMVFRTLGSPVSQSSFFINAIDYDGVSTTAATANADGDFVDADLNPLDPDEGQLSSHITVDLGIVELHFAADKKLEGMYYNAVYYKYLPLDEGLLGLDPVKLPTDGRVPKFRVGDVVVVHSTSSEGMPTGLVGNQVVNLSADNFEVGELFDQNGLRVDETLYTFDVDIGIVTMASVIDLSAYTQPLIAAIRIEDMKLCSDVSITGQLKFTSSLKYNYLAADTFVSSALLYGDLYASYTNYYSQTTSGSDIWNDNQQEANTTAQYNLITYPIQVVNKGAVKERWVLVFTSTSQFNIIGETRGQIGTGYISTDQSPINPATGEAYFTILADGFGGGWATGNVLRFNTTAANAPLWVARTTLQGDETDPTDEFIIQIRGDSN